MERASAAPRRIGIRLFYRLIQFGPQTSAKRSELARPRRFRSPFLERLHDLLVEVECLLSCRAGEGVYAPPDLQPPAIPVDVCPVEANVPRAEAVVALAALPPPSRPPDGGLPPTGCRHRPGWCRSRRTRRRRWRPLSALRLLIPADGLSGSTSARVSSRGP